MPTNNCDPSPPPSSGTTRTQPSPAPKPPPSVMPPPTSDPPPQPPPDQPPPSLTPLPGMPFFVPQQPPAALAYVPPGLGAREFFMPDQTQQGAPPPNSQQVQIPPTDPGSTNLYDRYACTVEYQYDAGLLQIPVAVDPTPSNLKPPCVLVRTHAPIGRKIVRYVARRVGVQPLVPAPVLTDPNATLLTASVVPEQPFLDGGANNWIYEVNATYVYALTQPVTSDQGYAPGVPAYSTLTNQATTLPAGNFVSGIVV